MSRRIESVDLPLLFHDVSSEQVRSALRRVVENRQRRENGKHALAKGAQLRSRRPFALRRMAAAGC